jgi:hypothetical protein
VAAGLSLGLGKVRRHGFIRISLCKTLCSSFVYLVTLRFLEGKSRARTSPRPDIIASGRARERLQE